MKNPQGFAVDEIDSLLDNLKNALEGSSSEFSRKITEKIIVELEAWKKDAIEYLSHKKPRDGEDGKTPTKEDILSLIKPLIPEAIPGEKGESGEPGEAVDEDLLIEKIIARIKPPKDGADAIVDKKMLQKIVKEEVEARMPKKKIAVADIAGLGKTLESMRVARNLGGHGGTMSKITVTSLGNAIYRLSKTINPAEIAVFVGGGRLFEENGDFSYPAGGHISQITLAAQFDVQVQSGTALNIRGK